MSPFSAITFIRNLFPDYSRGVQNMRVSTLVRLRWLAVFGQGITVVGVRYGLDFDLPLGACLLIVSLSAILNVSLTVRLPPNFRLDQSAVTPLLAFDILQLAGLLFLTGGLENPFIILFLAPVLISATALSPERTLMLGVLATGCATLLALAHQPLPWGSGEKPVLPFLYVTGIWLSLFVSMAFISVYAWQVGAEARQLAEALSAMELVLEREQHLSRLDGLAAAAAHELGTPLATIALVAKELSRNLSSLDPDTKADLDLLREQVVRCREILGQLSALGRAGDGNSFFSSVTLRHLIEDTIAPLRTPEIELDVTISGEGPEPHCVNKTALQFSLTNIIDNALDFAETRVSISASWDADSVRMEIRDDGKGYAPEVLFRLGEPYVTTRAANRDKHNTDGEGGGLGLGLFIAKTLIERSGAQLVFANTPQPGHGAVTSIVWHRFDFEHNAKPEEEQKG